MARGRSRVLKSIVKFAVAMALPVGLVATAASAANPVPPAELKPIPVHLLVDLGSGQVLDARHPDTPFLPASVTKVMTAYVAFEEIDAGRLSLDRVFVERPETEKEWFAKGTNMYLTVEDRPTTRDLLHGIMTQSANDACVVLAEGYAGSVDKWTAKMNAAAQRLGMTRSHYHTPNGWMDEGLTYVTARDMVNLADAMVTRHPRLYREFSGHKRWFWKGMAGEVNMRSHDPITGVVPGADGIKTGYTREAGYNFVGTDRKSTRLNSSHALSVPLVANREVHATLPKDSQRKISLSVHYRGPLVAPIRKGEEVGALEIKVEGLSPGHIPLYAARDVGKAGTLDRLWNGLITLFS